MERKKMNRNDIDIRKGKCCKTDNVRFDECFVLQGHTWDKAYSPVDEYDNVIYLEHSYGYYYYYAWDDGCDGFIYRQRED